MEERTSLVEVGDEIRNFRGKRIVVTSFERGSHGLLVYGEFDSGEWFAEYQPYELPPDEPERPFYNWASRETTTLASGVRVGCLAWIGSDGKLTLKDCEARWVKTQELMEAEEGVMQSRPTEIRLN